MNIEHNVENVDIENIVDTREQISYELHTIIEQYRNRQLTAQQERSLTEFYLRERYHNENNENKNTDHDMFTYLVTGWYVYEMLNKNITNDTNITNETNKNENKK